MLVVSNTSPITNLAAIGYLDLLRQLYQQIVIPDAVFDELVVGGQGHHPGGREVQTELWIIRHAVGNRATVEALLQQHRHLDIGEAEALVLAHEQQAFLLLIDEHTGRAVAHQLGIRRIGVLGVLREAKAQQLIPAVKPLLDTLRHNGFYLSDALYAHILQDVGE
ncbi:MAG: DUF3368 domain-containing protein [Chloroflexota bacterium]|nr:DUF3368 domain-containing protein [Chloroflexota bacterium]